MRSRWMSDDEPQRGTPWLTTYADMVTLILCFFVLLFSMSIVQMDKFRAVMSSLQGALGILDGQVPRDSPLTMHSTRQTCKRVWPKRCK